MLSLDQLDVKGRTVLVRSDLNTPLTGDDTPTIADDGRIRSALPTLVDLRARGARVVVMSHLGRPKGNSDPALSLRPVATRLGELLGCPVSLAADVAGPDSVVKAAALADGDVMLLENVRFEAAETSKDDSERGELADRMAALADAYVGDGFGVVHRKHASTYDVALRLPHAAGRLIESEVAVLRRLTDNPARPYAVVLGGSKVSDKLGVIDTLLGRADRILIGGGMAFTFLAALGHEVGTSLLEPDQIDRCRAYIARAEESGVRLVLPVDVVVADRYSIDAQPRIVPADAIPDDAMGLDIGPYARSQFIHEISDSRTVFWNGPMGVFEFPAFAEGTRSVAEALTRVQGLSVVGGGDSAAAVRSLGFIDTDFSHISTGGGASLEYLEGRDLPGLTALEA